MPGIAGIISKINRERNKKNLQVMIDCMMHEFFYTSDKYINDKLGFYTGWVCHKGSFSDCMPIFNEKKNLILFFSGENFVDKFFFDQLKDNGHEFNKFNASYLIHLYEDKGNGFLKYLNGWFSGIILDHQNEKIILFNDRYGVNRIYYYENKEGFFFSSEAKSLLKIRPELREIDPESLGHFFTCGCVLKNKTLFSNIFLLPAGSVWTFQIGKSLKKEYYFKPCIWENRPSLEKEIFYKRLRETFLNILPRYFYSKNPIAMSLTGGLDSRMILACMNTKTIELPCYTFGGIYRDCFDVIIARKVASVCNQKYYVLNLDGKFFSNFSNLAEKTIYITDGCHDVCGSHDLYFNQSARQIAPIRISGKFGSEVLRGASTFKTIPLNEKLFHSDFKKYIQEAGKTFISINNGNKLSFTVFRDVAWHEYGRLNIEQSQLIYRTPYMDNNLVSLLYQKPTDNYAPKEISLRLIAESNPTLFKIMTDRGFGGNSNFFLSKWIQFTYWLLFKTEWYYNEGMPHWLANIDYILKPLHIERLILGHNKIEHYRIWFRNKLSNYLRDILLDKQSVNRPYLNKNFLEQMVINHIKGNRNYINEINRALTAELIQRILIENI